MGSLNSSRVGTCASPVKPTNQGNRLGLGMLPDTGANLSDFAGGGVPKGLSHELFLKLLTRCSFILRCSSSASAGVFFVARLTPSVSLFSFQMSFSEIGAPVIAAANRRHIKRTCWDMLVEL